MSVPTLTVSSARPSTPASPRQILGWTLLALAGLIAWDMSGWDLPMARWFGDSQGFALRSDWFMVHVAHEGARMLAWLVALGLALSIWWPVGALRQVAYERRVQLVASALLSLLVIGLLKRLSTTSCPWDLAEFGGVGHYVSHWTRGLSDGGGGHCFPAGHASSGFAFLSLYFTLHHTRPQTARLCLAGVLAAGFALGLAQQMRGAHFMSHTLWTAWLCWTAAWIGDLLTTRYLARRKA
ncbi:phosphoesterase [Comamonas phosphati]|nr:phosphoesterase [Comamonas phosphati]